MSDDEVLQYLLDSDGSTRDITFTPATHECVSEFLKVFLATYSAGELNDQDGLSVELSHQEVMNKLASKEGCVHGQLKAEGSLIGQVQLFIDWPEDEKIAIEVSYFPCDLHEEFTLEKFLSKLNQWWGLLQSSEVFVRYENASWEWYNPKGLGVFYHASRA